MGIVCRMRGLGRCMGMGRRVGRRNGWCRGCWGSGGGLRVGVVSGGWCLMMGAVGGYSARVGVGSEKVKKVKKV